MALSVTIAKCDNGYLLTYWHRAEFDMRECREIYSDHDSLCKRIRDVFAETAHYPVAQNTGD